MHFGPFVAGSPFPLNSAQANALGLDLTKLDPTRSTSDADRYVHPTQPTKTQLNIEALEATTKALKEAFPPSLNPRQVGIRAEDDQTFRRFASKIKGVILVRDTNPASLPYISRDDVFPKPMELKAKTLKEGKNAGLVGCGPSLFESEAEWLDALAQLRTLGFSVAGPEEQYLVKDTIGHTFHADYDLHGAYSCAQPEHAPFEPTALMYQLNLRFGKEMIQHPPHDMWSKRNAPGPNQGPRPPATAYLPNGEAVHLEDKADMKRFYKLANVNWSKIYPPHVA